MPTKQRSINVKSNSQISLTPYSPLRFPSYSSSCARLIRSETFSVGGVAIRTLGASMTMEKAKARRHLPLVPYPSTSMSPTHPNFSPPPKHNPGAHPHLARDGRDQPLWIPQVWIQVKVLMATVVGIGAGEGRRPPLHLLPLSLSPSVRTSHARIPQQAYTPANSAQRW